MTIFSLKVDPIPSLFLIWHSNTVFEGLRFLPVGVCCFFAVVDVVVVGDAVAVAAVAVVAPAVGNIVGVASATYGWLAHHQVAEVGDAVTYDGCGDAQSHFVDLHEPEKILLNRYAM